MLLKMLLKMYQEVCGGFIQSFGAFRYLTFIHKLLQGCLMKGTTANMSTMWTRGIQTWMVLETSVITVHWNTTLTR